MYITYENSLLGFSIQDHDELSIHISSMSTPPSHEPMWDIMDKASIELTCCRIATGVDDLFRLISVSVSVSSNWKT